jgi:hypothetical protein
MQFKHPELLYALLLLLIPIIIHLFQLRRFQKIDFTNVAFLKKVTIETRKSSQLKKWLTLLMRLGAMACLIFAFAQPFSASKTALNTQKETVLYLDNSFSMQAKSGQGPLLQRAMQDLYEQSAGNEKISWFTNSNSRKNASVQDFKNEVLKVPYSQNQLTLSEVLLKANQLFSKEKGLSKRLILVSDFQLKEAFPEVPEDLTLDAVHLKPNVLSNISIDTTYIDNKNSVTTRLTVVVSKSGETSENIPVSLFNGKALVAKTAIEFGTGTEAKVSFDIETEGGFNGKLELIDSNLSYDNSLFFSINIPQRLRVMSISESNANFIQRLFDQPEFEYSQQTFKNLNYNDIPTQNFIVLNELNEIPVALVTALKSFVDNGGSLFVIPSAKAGIQDYNILLNQLQLGSFSGVNTQEKKITQIVFDHPLYKDVFERRVVNFQYPKVNSFFNTSTTATPALKFEDGKPFIVQRKNTYLSTAAINPENSNFQNSPLIVPTVYNMASQSLLLPKLYYTVGEQNNFSVPITLVQNEILTLKDSVTKFIPLQQTKANKVNITTGDLPANAGTYQIEKDGEFIENVSYNYKRDESSLQYANPNDWNGARIYESVDELFSSIAEENTIHSFWKWFAIFALVFLLLEMLILKFYKG